MLALVPLLVIVAVFVAPIIVQIRNGWTHADDAWTPEQRTEYYRAFTR